MESKKRELQKKSEKLKLLQGGSAHRVPRFYGKIIQYKMFDEEQGKDVWYKGIVTEELDDDEFDVNWEFTVMYEGYEDTYTVKLLEEHNNKCVVMRERLMNQLSKNRNKLFNNFKNP